MRPSPRLAWFCLLSAVVLVPLAVGVVPLSGVPLGLNAFVQPKVIVLALTLGVCVASWALSNLRADGLFLGRALAPVAAFVAAALLATAFAPDVRLAVFGDMEQGVGWLVFALCSLALFLVTQLVRDAARLKTLTDAVIYTAVGVAAIGLMQQVFAFDVLGFGGRLSAEYIIQRGFGTIGNADTYAAYLVIPSLLAFVRLVDGNDRDSRIRWGAALAAIAASLILSQTRAPLVGLVAAGVTYGVISLTKRSRPKGKPARAKTRPSRVSIAVLVIATSVAAVVVAVMVADASDIAARFSLRSLLELGGRLPLWRSAVDIIAENPLLGVGPDSYRLGWYGIRPASHLAAGTGLVITDPHSVPLLIGATMGIVGLLAAALLAFYSLAIGLRTTLRFESDAKAQVDYRGWFYGAVALSVTLVATLLTNALLFMLLVALGILIAPSLTARQAAPPVRSAVTVASVAIGLLLIVFAVMSLAAQLVAVGGRVDDPELARARAARASALAPWDTELRNLRIETQVQAALAAVFDGTEQGQALVDEAADALASAGDRVPEEYLFPYQSSVLLIGSGQRIGPEYTRRGIEAGVRGLQIYPNSLELRTGMATGYLQLNRPDEAKALLTGKWDADPAYLPSGLVYVQSLAALGERDEAIRALETLKARFPGDPSVIELENKVATQSEG